MLTQGSEVRLSDLQAAFQIESEPLDSFDLPPTGFSLSGIEKQVLQNALQKTIGIGLEQLVIRV